MGIANRATPPYTARLPSPLANTTTTTALCVFFSFYLTDITLILLSIGIVLVIYYVFSSKRCVKDALTLVL